MAGYQPGDPQQLYLFDRATGSFRLITHRHDEPLRGADAHPEATAISYDGRWVAFSSSASDLIPGYEGQYRQAYLFDSVDGSVRLVSHAMTTTTQGSEGGGLAHSMSQDGRFLVFTSGGPIAAICQDLLGVADRKAAELNFSLVNSAVTKLLYNSEGRVSLSYLNNFAHLEQTGQAHAVTYR